jgi:hypothetical protein
VGLPGGHCAAHITLAQIFMLHILYHMLLVNESNAAGDSAYHGDRLLTASLILHV